MLPDHRREYLDYEGPVSGDRGRVWRWDSGVYQAEHQADDEWVVSLSGVKLRGQAVLTRIACTAVGGSSATRRCPEVVPEALGWFPGQSAGRSGHSRSTPPGRSRQMYDAVASSSSSTWTGLFSLLRGEGTKRAARDRPLPCRHSTARLSWLAASETYGEPSPEGAEATRRGFSNPQGDYIRLRHVDADRQRKDAFDFATVEARGQRQGLPR